MYTNTQIQNIQIPNVEIQKYKDSFPIVNQSHQSIHPLHIVNQIHKYTNIQKYKIYKYKNSEYTKIQLHKYKLYKENVYKYTNTKIVFPPSINPINQSTP